VFSGLESRFHWLVLGVIALIVLGPERLPEAGRALGEGIRSFRSALVGDPEPHASAPPRSLSEEQSPVPPERRDAKS